MGTLALVLSACDETRVTRLRIHRMVDVNYPDRRIDSA